MLFLNSFLSYLMLLLVIVAIAGLAVFIGISLRKKKNASEQKEEIVAEENAN